MTPEEKLSSRSWRLRNSLGLLWSILSFGILTGVGFLFRGIKSKNKLWIFLGIGFLVVGFGVFYTADMVGPSTEENPNASLGYTIWGWVMFSLFVGGVITSIVTNKKWLLWKAYADDRKWYTTAGAPSGSTFPPTSYGTHSQSVATSLATPTLPATHAPQHMNEAANQSVAFTPQLASEININSASVQELTASLGIDSASAERIVSTRLALGSFASFEELMTKAQVQPHLLLPHRNKIAFGPSQGISSPHVQRPTGKANQNVRKLDI